MKTFNGLLVLFLGLVEPSGLISRPSGRPTAASGDRCPPTSSRAGNGDSWSRATRPRTMFFFGSSSTGWRAPTRWTALITGCSKCERRAAEWAVFAADGRTATRGFVRGPRRPARQSWTCTTRRATPDQRRGQDRPAPTTAIHQRPPSAASTDYKETAGARGAFDLIGVGDRRPTSGEHACVVTSAGWRRAPDGRTTMSHGDGAGSIQIECWGAAFRADIQRQALGDSEISAATRPSAPHIQPLSERLSPGSWNPREVCWIVWVPAARPDGEGPITLAEHFRRIDPRYERQLEVEVLPEGKKHGSRTVNISLGGLFLDSEIPSDRHDRAAALQLPTQPEPVEVAGDVRWVVRKGAGQARRRDLLPGPAGARRLGAEPVLPERLASARNRPARLSRGRAAAFDSPRRIPR